MNSSIFYTSLFATFINTNIIVNVLLPCSKWMHILWVPLYSVPKFICYFCIFGHKEIVVTLIFYRIVSVSTTSTTLSSFHTNFDSHSHWYTWIKYQLQCFEEFCYRLIANMLIDFYHMIPITTSKQTFSLQQTIKS